MRFRSIAKYLFGVILKPTTKFYLRKERTYSYKGIDVKIPPGVFHPGLFFSTKILLNFLKKSDFRGKTCLELGAGSGLISCYLAKHGAIVTATDISNKAIEAIKINAELNNVTLEIIQSDLFDSIINRQYKYIIINPPFYFKNPVTEPDFAWLAGENGNYFNKLLLQIKNYLQPSSKAFMILSDECNLDFIHNEAMKNGIQLAVVLQKRRGLDIFFVFELQKLPN